MKVKRINIIEGFVLTLVMFLISCNKDWFDAKSDLRLTVPSSIQDFEYLLDNLNVMNTNTPGLAEIASDGHYIPEARWQTLTNSVSNDAQRNAYTWSNNFPYQEVRDWNFGYEKVFYCNLALQGLVKIQPKNLEEKQRWEEVKGNALFHRAKNYFDLAQVYAVQYDESTADIDMGIPLRGNTDIVESSSQSTVRQTYNQIVNDLLAARHLLPDLPKFPSRGSKSGVFALLARTFLVIGKYNEAGLYADSCLMLQNSLIDYNTQSATSSNLGRFNKETIFYSQMTNYQLTFQTGYIFVEASLFQSYADDDLRKTRFFTSNASGIRFKGNYNNSDLRFTGLATDEIFLIRAECFARMRNTGAALKCLNDLIKTRWKNSVPYVEITANDADDALLTILNERRKELLLRGLRWTDLRRLNKDDKFKMVLNREIGGHQFQLEPNNFRYTFPIPYDVLQLSKLKQNYGW